LIKLSHQDIWKSLEGLSDDELLELVDVRSNRVGDNAVGLLGSRGQFDKLIDGILDSRIHTANGKLRATSTLLAGGIHIPRAQEAYLALLSEMSAGVVDNALLGLVFSQKKSHIPKIEAALKKAKPGSQIQKSLERAIEALKKESPSFFAPYYGFAKGLWPPDKSRPKK
jgi:hypothetical protein